MGFATKIIAVGVLIAICYVAASVIIVLLVSALLAIFLEPGVEFLRRLRVPLAAGAFLMVASLGVFLYLFVAFSYGRAETFARGLPNYSEVIRERVSRIVDAAQGFERQIEQIFQSSEETQQRPPASHVTVTEHSVLTEYIFPGFETAFALLVAVSLIPFLTFFMLTWKEHLLRSFLHIFTEANRQEVAQSIRDIASVFQSFLYGNLLLGVILSGSCLALFLWVGLPFPYILALLSGFVTLIPYLGMILSIALPFMFALGQPPTEQLALLAGLIVIHLIGLNVLLPKLVGSMVAVNPLVVTAALLVWGWMWGAMGFILAVPIMAAAKAVCDNVPKLKPYGKLLGTE